MSVTLKNVTEIYFDFGKLSPNLLPKNEIVNWGYDEIHEDSLFIEGTQHGDYSGDIVYMSNAMALKETYPFLETVSLSYNFQQTYIPGDIEISSRDMYEKVVSLLEDIVHLENYIVYDESHLSELESTLQTEAVEEWLSNHYGKLDNLIEFFGEERVTEAMWEVIHNLNSDNQLFHNEHNGIWLDSDAALTMLEEFFEDELRIRKHYIRTLLLSDYFTMGYWYGVGEDEACSAFCRWLNDEDRTLISDGTLLSINIDDMPSDSVIARFTQYVKAKAA